MTFEKEVPWLSLCLTCRPFVVGIATAPWRRPGRTGASSWLLRAGPTRPSRTSWATPTAVRQRHVQQALAEQQSESAEELRELAAGRLDALLSACWAKAMTGDLAVVRSCLSVVLAQVKLHDLGPRLVRCTQPQTVVLFEDDCRLRGCPDHVRAVGSA